MNLYVYRVSLVRVVDGDTVILDVDCGFNIWLHGLRFRLSRINAPELSTPEGIAARDWMIAELAKAPPLQLTCQSTGLDKWGRHLAELYDSGANINDQIVAAGHAVYVTY